MPEPDERVAAEVRDEEAHLLGVDHVLFVLAVLLLVNGFARLVATVTALKFSVVMEGEGRRGNPRF